MSHQYRVLHTDLNDIRRRVYRTATQDGLLEILTGVGFAAAACFTALDVLLDIPLFFLIGIPASILPALMPGLRQRLTYPRTGYVDLVSDEGKRLVHQMLLASLLFGVGLLLSTLLMAAFNPSVVIVVALFENLAILLGLLVCTAFVWMAVRYGITRFYMLGLLSVTGAAIAYLIDIEAVFASDDPVARWMVYFGLMALVFLPTGVWLFTRFVRDYPVLEGEPADA